MAPTPKAQKEKVTAEFRALTNSIPADASRICKKAGYRLDTALDIFYSDSVAQSNAERSLQSRSKALQEGFEALLNAQFDQLQDPDDSSRMDMEGISAYLESLSLTPEDPKVVCLCHLLHAPQLGRIDRSDFLQSWTSLLQGARRPVQSAKDLIEYQIEAIAQLERRLKSEPAYFQGVYLWLFDFGRDVEKGQKNLGLDVAIAFWELVVPLTPQLDPSVFRPDYLQWWFELLRSRNKAVTRDTWDLFYDFIVQLEENFKNYDESAAWPSLIDDYVTVARQKLQAEGMEVC